MTLASWLPVLLSLVSLTVPVDRSEQYFFSNDSLVVLSQDTLTKYLLDKEGKPVDGTPLLDYFKKSDRSVYYVTSTGDTFYVSGANNTGSNSGFWGRLSTGMTKPDTWNLTKGLPLAHIVSGDSVFISVARTEQGVMNYYLQEYSIKGDFKKDLIPPIAFEDSDTRLMKLSLPYFRMGSFSDHFIYVIEPYNMYIFLIDTQSGDVEELHVKIDMSQIQPIVRFKCLTSYFRYHDRQYVIINGIRMTNKIVPYLVEINDQGEVITIQSLEDNPVYVAHAIGDSLVGNTFNFVNKQTEIVTLPLSDLFGSLPKK